MVRKIKRRKKLKNKNRKRSPPKRGTDFRNWKLSVLFKKVKEVDEELSKCSWPQVFLNTYGHEHKANESYQKFRYSDDRDDGGVREYLIEKLLKALRSEIKKTLLRS